jgi:hypothetical protein
MIAYFINSEISVAISLDAVRHVMHRCPCFKNVTGIPMERERVEVDFSEIENFYEGLQSEVTGLPSAMEVNLNETGHQDWVDGKGLQAVVPVSYEDSSIHVPCDHSSKQASLLVCIGAYGTFVKPMVIVPRRALEQGLYEIGYTPDRVTLEHQENCFISTRLFEKWAIDVLLPHVAVVRRRLEDDGWGTLLLDGHPCHHSENFLERCHDVSIIQGVQVTP